MGGYDRVVGDPGLALQIGVPGNVRMRREETGGAGDIYSEDITLFKPEGVIGKTILKDAFLSAPVAALIVGESRDVIAQQIPAAIGLLHAQADVESRVLAVAADGESCAHPASHVETLLERWKDEADHVIAPVRLFLNPHSTEAQAA